MNSPAFEFVPADIIPKLAGMKPYLLVILKKGKNYERESTRQIIQSEHLPYTFQLKEQGILSIAFPVRDNTDITAIGIYNLSDKAEAERYVLSDPAIIQEIFTYEILSGMGLQGDKLL